MSRTVSCKLVVALSMLINLLNFSFSLYFTRVQPGQRDRFICSRNLKLESLSVHTRKIGMTKNSRDLQESDKNDRMKVVVS